MTRKEEKEKKYLLNNIAKIPYDTIKYLYYECFHKEEKNINKMIDELLIEIKNNKEHISQLYTILNPISMN